MSSIGGPCVKCGDVGPLGVDKSPSLRLWSTYCHLCGHSEGYGSYWKYMGQGTAQENWVAHCKSLGWNPDNLDGGSDDEYL